MFTYVFFPCASQVVARTVEVPFTSFLDPVLGAMMKQVFRQTLKPLAAECLVGVRLELLNFLIPVCAWIDCFGCLHLVRCRWLFVLDRCR